ncbi:MAG: helix-turn-helix domain-containing protein [Chitinivibrionales bacterium]|nr:helix-turn-helix domain-containing protein [Chitinivibrionales bacterium]MBD3395781.1 helix-turn-helix domain-containing protein [Chitinivibrionales bacterium]
MEESVLLPLYNRPHLLMAGIATHGHSPKERFCNHYYALHLYRYRAKLRIGRHSFDTRLGHVSITPANVPSEYTWQEANPTHVYIHFEFREEGTPGEIAVPLLTDTGQDFNETNAGFEDLVGLFVYNPIRAEIRLWDMLWDIADRFATESQSDESFHPALRAAMGRIERMLSTGIGAGEIARDTGYSLNHLNRLFAKGLDTTVHEYILSRRMSRAQYLLKYTDLPVKAIAWECGIRDLQLFNKTVRRRLGMAPTKIAARYRGRN